MASESYEKKDIEPRVVWVSSAITAVLSIVMFISLVITFRYFNNRETIRGKLLVTAPAVTLKQLPPAPRLQAAPEKDLFELRVKEDEELNNYRWLDKNAGRVQVPIEKAIDLLSARGLPVTRTRPDTRPQ